MNVGLLGIGVGWWVLFVPLGGSRLYTPSILVGFPRFLFDEYILPFTHKKKSMI